MALDKSLEVVFGDYRRGTLGKRNLEGILFQWILDNPRSFGIFYRDKDDCIDFLTWLYPRLSRSIERYEDVGSTFAGYMASMVRFSFKEYRMREEDHRITEAATWRERASDGTEVHEEEAEYYQNAPSKVPNPRQVLILLLKSYYFVTDDLVKKAAPALGVDPERIGEFIAQLKALRLGQEDEYRALRDRVHAQFYRCITFERRLERSPEGSARRMRLEGALDRGRKRLASMRRRLSRMRVEASNREVAQVLGIPKGTVDAHLQACKTLAARMERRRAMGEAGAGTAPAGNGGKKSAMLRA